MRSPRDRVEGGFPLSPPIAPYVRVSYTALHDYNDITNALFDNTRTGQRALGGLSFRWEFAALLDLVGS